MSKEAHKKNSVNVPALRADLGKAVGLMPCLLPGDALWCVGLAEEPVKVVFTRGIHEAKKI